jgi:hypothetical protein
LTFEELPEVQNVAQPAAITTSSTREGSSVPATLSSNGAIDWTSGAADAEPWLALDFHGAREFGGLAIGWDEQAYPHAYEIQLSEDGQSWAPAVQVSGGNGGYDYVAMPEIEARGLRIRAKAPGGAIHLRSVRIMAPAFGENPNVLLRQAGDDAPRGRYPRYLRGEQTAWTVVGVEGDMKEALFSADGALEVDKSSYSIEPFVRIDGKLLTWADADIYTDLADDYLPIPTVHWRVGEFELAITALANGTAGKSSILLRYELKNRSKAAQSGELALALRPLQVLPPWQDLNITGGFSPIDDIRMTSDGATVNGRRIVHLFTPADRFGATSFVGGDIVEHFAAPAFDLPAEVQDSQRLASGGWLLPFELQPDSSQAWIVGVALGGAAADEKTAPLHDWDVQLAAAKQHWRAELRHVDLELPPSAKLVADTFRTIQGHILINRDGPAIQPGSRSYERSWIRDGALTSTALLATGHTDEAREFLNWYAPYQYESGKIPCVVDRRGPDPVNEHDSNGEYLYALLKLYRFTGDKTLLETQLPRVIAAVDYIAGLRAQRTTKEFAEGGEEKRAYYGLVPESISHEGYSAKPMHSYWDNFFIQKGLRDAVTIAHLLGRQDLEARFTAERDAHAKALHESLQLSMKLRKVDYLPGCVELGDFDATSTTIALFPCGEQARLPQPQLQNTFDRYYDFFVHRRDGKLEWTGYTPYEVRVIGSFAILGQRERCGELIQFFLQDQRPAGWNQWAEVVHRDKKFPGFIGDMPHTWVGSDFINAIRTMLVYERPEDEALVLAAGVPRAWIEESPGIRISGFPTEYGKISFQLSGDGQQLNLNVEGPEAGSPGGIFVDIRGLGPFRHADWNGAPLPGTPDQQVKLPSARGRLTLGR